MLIRPALRLPRRWPIWLLVAAWLCANGPQMACFEVVVWLKGAGHFSHYHRLAASAAAALEGRAEAEPQWAAAVAQHPIPVSIPAEATPWTPNALEICPVLPNFKTHRFQRLSTGVPHPPPT